MILQIDHKTKYNIHTYMTSFYDIMYISRSIQKHSMNYFRAFVLIVTMLIPGMLEHCVNQANRNGNFAWYGIFKGIIMYRNVIFIVSTLLLCFSVLYWNTHISGLGYLILFRCVLVSFYLALWSTVYQFVIAVNSAIKMSPGWKTQYGQTWWTE